MFNSYGNLCMNALLNIAMQKKTELEQEKSKKKQDEDYWVRKVKETFTRIQHWLEPLIKEGYLSEIELSPDRPNILKEYNVPAIYLEDGIDYRDCKFFNLLDKEDIAIVDQGIDIVGGFGRIDIYFKNRTIMIILLAKDGSWILRERYEENEKEFNQANFEELIAEFLESL